MLTGYATWNQGPFYAGGSFGAGDLKFKDVHRNIELVPTVVRTEQGSAKGSHFVGRVVGGMNMLAGIVTHGPIMSLTWQQIKVNGFAENGQNSTTMLFSEQERKSLIGSLGYGVSARVGDTVAMMP